MDFEAKIAELGLLIPKPANLQGVINPVLLLIILHIYLVKAHYLRMGLLQKEKLGLMLI